MSIVVMSPVSLEILVDRYPADPSCRRVFSTPEASIEAEPIRRLLVRSGRNIGRYSAANC
jgi:hypothetical protein